MTSFETMLEQDQKFIKQIASKSCGHYIDEHDDEWSIALSAYYEAFQKYEDGKGDFHAFAATVIKRRLIDFFRTHKADEDAVSLDEEPREEGQSTPLTDVERRMMHEQTAAESRREEILSEIDEIKEVLDKYGIGFYDLAEASPKAGKTKKICAAAICCVVDFFMELMRRTRLLPIKQINEKRDLPRKKLERHRKYIIAGSEILDGDFPVLQEYFEYVRREGM